MWVQSHLLLSLVILGPSPEAIAGCLLPDVSSNLNWINKFLSRKVSFNQMINKREKFNVLIDDGKLWFTHNVAHSLIFCLIIGLPVFLINNKVYTYFLLSYLLHVFTDYLTHKKGSPLFYPFSKRLIRLGIVDYNPGNYKVEIIGDLFLLFIFLVRMYYL